MFRKKQRIFCLSYQRTGTTSVGGFFKHFGFKVADWDISYNNDWSVHWYQEEYDQIFRSKAFKRHTVFEDDPWFLPGFHEHLYARFPNARFILFTRKSEDWFNSMMSHSGGKNPGNSLIHAKVYNRMDEWNEMFPGQEASFDLRTIDNALDLSPKKEHYLKLYDERNAAIKAFFDRKDPDALFTASLEDEDKWQRLGAFFNLEVPEDFDVHFNKSLKA